MSVGSVQPGGAAIGMQMDNLMQDASVRSTTASADAPASSLVRERAVESHFSSKMWTPTEETDFSMSTYTKNGTLIQVEAGERGFTMGKFENAATAGTNKFQLAGARDDLNMQVVFTTSDGNTKAFKLTESSVFHETEDGKIEEGRGHIRGAKDPNDPKNMKDENNIIINLDDKGYLDGGTGDDVLINFGAEARVNGNDGDDSIISMGDKVTLNGGMGDDLIKVIDDVIRKPKDSTIDLDAVDYDGSSRPLGSNMLGSNESNGLMDLLPVALVGGRNKGTEATINGGDGNDVIDARDAKLERADVKGGAGDDIMMLDIIAASTVKGGDGDDTISVKNALMSTIDGGAGNDEIKLDKGKMTTILGGKGDDTITAGFIVDSAIFGGEGNDTIKVTKGVDTLIDGGRGDDLIKVDEMWGGAILGGMGDDTLLVKEGNATAIMGGEGDDTIVVGVARKSIIMGNEGNDSIGVIVAEANLIAGGEGDDRIRTGLGIANIIDGGAGNDDIGVNLLGTNGLAQFSAEQPISDAELQETADFLKSTLKNSSRSALSEEQWLERAREWLAENPSLKKEQEAGQLDFVIDDGAIVYGPEGAAGAKILNSRLDGLTQNMEHMRLSSGQQAGLKTYMDSLRKLMPE